MADYALYGKATQFKSGSEAAKAGGKGGVASGKAKRRKKAFRSALDVLLTKPIPDSDVETRAELERLGLGDEDSMAMAMVLKIVKRALLGDSRAFIAVRDTMGEKPGVSVKVSAPPAPPSDMFDGMSDEDLRAIIAGEYDGLI